MATVEIETRSPVEIARDVFENVLNQRNADALRTYWADDLVEELPTGTYRGPDEMAQYFAETFAALPDFHIEPEEITTYLPAQVELADDRRGPGQAQRLVALPIEVLIRDDTLRGGSGVVEIGERQVLPGRRRVVADGESGIAAL